METQLRNWENISKELAREVLKSEIAVRDAEIAGLKDDIQRFVEEKKVLRKYESELQARIAELEKVKSSASQNDALEMVMLLADVVSTLAARGGDMERSNQAHNIAKKAYGFKS